VKYPTDIVSGYRSYDDQVLNFGSKAKTRGVDDTQKSNSLPGFSQHHTGKAFDIFSVENSWWDANKDVKEWVSKNASKYGFEVTYVNTGKLRVPEPWHLYYVGGESSESSTTTPTIPNSKVDDYYSSDKVDPKLEKTILIIQPLETIEGYKTFFEPLNNLMTSDEFKKIVQFWSNMIF
jgi:hypothetical protein